jgi:hypothetical protein
MAKSYTLIVPDIHENLAVLTGDTLINLEHEAKRVVYLGDYFDTFIKCDAPMRRLSAVADEVAWRAAYPDKFTMLLGNHDIHYQFKHPWFRCSGYQSEKRDTINRHMGEVWLNMPVFTWVGKYLVSHAGFHPATLPIVASSLEEATTTHLADLKARLEGNQENSLDLLRQGYAHPWFLAGATDGGMGFGGPLWLRWPLFHDIPNLPQIVGHTPSRDELTRIRGASYCIDNSAKAGLKVWNDGLVETVSLT